MTTHDYRIYQPIPKSERGAHIGTVVAIDPADAYRQCDAMYACDSYYLREAGTDEIVPRPE